MLNLFNEEDVELTDRQLLQKIKTNLDRQRHCKYLFYYLTFCEIIFKNKKNIFINFYLLHCPTVCYILLEKYRFRLKEKILDEPNICKLFFEY